MKLFSLFGPLGWRRCPQERRRKSFCFIFFLLCFLHIVFFVFFGPGSVHKARTENQGLYREHNKTRDSQTQILVPRFIRKQNKGGKWLVLTLRTQKKSYLKVALSFCCKRRGKWCYNSDVLNFLFLFRFLFVCSSAFSWMDWLTELWLQSCFKQLGAKKQ